MKIDEKTVQLLGENKMKEKLMSFNELRDIILTSPKIKSEYRQASIIILRKIFKDGFYRK